MRTHLWAIVIVSVIAIAACSGSGTTPTSPSNTQTTAASGTGSSGVSNNNANDPEIEGTITALPPTTAASTFTVAGKTVMTTSSTVFDNNGVTKTFADLKVGLKVEVNGTLSGTTLMATRVEIESAAPTPMPPTPAPTPAPSVKVQGTVSGLTGTASSFQFMVGTTLVKGDGSTKFSSGGEDSGDAVAIKDVAATTFANLKNGVMVEVEGTQQTGFVQAVQIHIQTPQAVTIQLHGTIAGLTGSASAFQFMLGPTLVKGDASTKITGGGDNNDDAVVKDETSLTFANLKNGAMVEVTGTQQTGFVQAVQIQVESQQNAGNQAEVEGSLGTITGTCPAISTTVGTTKVTTTASTSFGEGGCAALKAGMKVQVTGTRNADGSITATKVERDD